MKRYVAISWDACVIVAEVIETSADGMLTVKAYRCSSDWNLSKQSQLDVHISQGTIFEVHKSECRACKPGLKIRWPWVSRRRLGPFATLFDRCVWYALGVTVLFGGIYANYVPEVKPAPKPLTSAQCVKLHEAREKRLGRILHVEGGDLTDTDCYRLHCKYPGYFPENPMSGEMPIEQSEPKYYRDAIEQRYGETMADAN